MVDTPTTKTQFSDELRISAAALSAMLKRGLPERSDGKLDRVSALEWVAQQKYRGARLRTREIIIRASELFATDPVAIPGWQRALERFLNHLASAESLAEFVDAMVAAGVPNKHAVTAAGCLVKFLEDSYQTGDGRQWFKPEAIPE